MKGSELGQAVVIAVVLSVVFVVSYAVFGHTLLLRPLWMDEVHSWLLISDPDPIHALRSLQQGADYNPPVYYAVAKVFTWIVPLNEHNLRALSALLVLSTAIGLALVFDRHMKMPASIGCALLICSQELMILQSTEVRFYALWLALLTWFCFGLTTGKRSLKAVQYTLLSVFAALTAGTHYFGIISIGLVCAAFVAARKFEKDALVRAGIPFATAVITVACCLPLLSGQKAALTSETWVTAADSERMFAYVSQFFPRMLLLVSFAIWLMGFFLRSSDPDAAQMATEESDSSGRLPEDHVPPDAMFVFGSLLLMPVVLIVFSLVVQPALVNRYSIVSCLGLVPVLAFLLKTGERRKSILVLVAGCVMFAWAVRSGSATWDHKFQSTQQLTEELQQLPETKVVLFEDRIDYWMMQHKDPHSNWYQLDFEFHPTDDVANLRIVQRDVGRAIERVYPNRFPLKSLTEFEGQDVFLVPYQNQQPFKNLLSAKRTLTKVGDRIFKAWVPADLP
ncbi:MAG: hypothetical protein ABJZ55_07780 [Fuerstiella sp.]